MDIDELIDKFYNENISTEKYSKYGSDENVEELIVTKEIFKENLKKLIGFLTN